MRLSPVAVVVSILAVALHAEQVPDPATLDRARTERKPILLFERPERCTGLCATFEQSLAHPAVKRRLQEVVMVARPAKEGALVLYDRSGTLVTRMPGLPRDATALGTVLDGILSVKPNLERAAALDETGPHEGDLERAAALIILGRADDARAAVNRAVVHGSTRTREYAVVVRSMLDVSEGKSDEALAALSALTTSASTGDIAATAWIGIGSIHRGAGEFGAAIAAYTKAAGVAGPGSATHATATAALAQLQTFAEVGVIRINPLHEQIVTERRTVRTTVSSANVARVVFTVDGEQTVVADRPPFSAVIDFGRIPQAQTIRAVAHDFEGKEIGRHELTVNHAGEMFWIRLIEPREGKAAGNVRVTATLRAPAGRLVKRVTVSWNDVERAVLTHAPWQADIEVPAEMGVLRASAELDDGRTAEDAVLLNASGLVERSYVPLVEIPVTITEGNGSPAKVAAADLVVREGNTKRVIESVVSGSETPLTVGLLLDTSESMYKRLLDVQEAALTFLDTAMGPDDRAFLVTFDSYARLVQPPTSDRETLRRQIMGIRTAGATALHDAMILGLLQFEGIKGRRSMVVFSDGSDNASRYQAGDVEELARRSNIPIYMIATRAAYTGPPISMAPAPRQTRVNDPGFFPPLQGPSPGALLHKAGAMRRTVDATGGTTHHLDKLEDLPAAYAKIAAALRAQSLVVIRTDPGRSENDWRKIEVDVEGRKRDVRAPRGYYAPW